MKNKVLKVLLLIIVALPFILFLIVEKKDVDENFESIEKQEERYNFLKTGNYDDAFKDYDKKVEDGSDLDIFFLKFVNEILKEDINNSPDGILDESDQFIKILNVKNYDVEKFIKKIVENYSGTSTKEVIIYLTILDSYVYERSTMLSEGLVDSFKIISFENRTVTVSGTYFQSITTPNGITRVNDDMFFEFTNTDIIASGYRRQLSKKYRVDEHAQNIIEKGIDKVKYWWRKLSVTANDKFEDENTMAVFAYFYHGRFYATETGDIIFIKYNEKEKKERIEDGNNDREAERESKLGYIKKSNMGDAAKVLAVNILYGTKEVESNPNLLEGININVDMSEISVGDIEKINSIIQAP